MKDTYIYFLYACIAAAFCVAFFTVGVPNSNAVIAAIVCYYVAAAAILLLAGFAASTIADLTTGIRHLRPFVSIFALLLISGIMLNSYYSPVSAGKVAPSFYTFARISIILLGIQTASFFYALINAGGAIDRISRKTMSFLALVAALNMIAIITEGITLKYFSTDC